MLKKLIFSIHLLSFLWLCTFSQVQAQEMSSETGFEDSSISKKEKRKRRPIYISVGLGINSSKFRDFATSPLFYSGYANHLSLSASDKDIFRETEVSFTYDFGIYSASFNSNISLSGVEILEFYYSELYRIRKLSSNSFNTKVGFQLIGTGNLRINSDLENNAVGMELLGNFMGSAKFTLDISRKKEQEKKKWFVKYKLKEKKRDLAFRFNVGLVNSSFRNGYAYSGQSYIVNSPETFDDYEYRLFSGLRLGSRVDYTRYLQNNNGLQLSYIWSAYKTGKDLHRFEMAHHQLRLSLLFNTNNK